MLRATFGEQAVFTCCALSYVYLGRAAQLDLARLSFLQTKVGYGIPTEFFNPFVPRLACEGATLHTT